MPPSTCGRCGVPARCATMARLPPHSVPSPAKSGPSSAHSTVVRVAAEQAPAMVERERRRRRGAEIVGGHRPGERRHSGVRQRGELEGREIAVAEPALPGVAASAAEIEAVEQARPAIAAAHGDGELRRRDRPPCARSPRGARRRAPKTAASASCRWIDDDPVAERRQPGDGAFERGRLGRRSPPARRDRCRGPDSSSAARSSPRREEIGQQPAAFVGAERPR